MTTLRIPLLLSATITGNLIVAFAVRQGLLALGANELLAGWIASTIWGLIATAMLTSLAMRLNRRNPGSGANGSSAPRISRLIDSEATVR